MYSYIYMELEREEIYCMISIFFAVASADVFVCMCMHVCISFKKFVEFIIYS